MSQLHSLISSLNDAELDRLKDIRLIGKEKAAFDYISRYKDKELPGNETMLKALDITDTHFYKINSVLLRKFYDALVPAGGIELLNYLRKKNLFTLLRHEILAQDKKWSSEKKGKDKENFYLSCFHFLIDFPYKFYDKKLRDAFGEKYLEAKKDAGKGDEAYVRFHKLFSDSNRFAAQKNPGKTFGHGPKELEAYEKELSGTKYYLAQYYLYRTFCSYFTYYEKSSAKVLEYLNKAIALKDKIKDFFPVNIGQFLRLLYADALFDMQSKEAYKLYKEVFDEGVSENMYGYYYHCEQYALAAIIQEKYDKALSICDNVFKPVIDSRNDIFATRGALTYAKLYLSNGEYKNALQYIHLARSINEKAFYLPFDVQLRLLENIHFFVKGDLDFAHQLANRNIKFVKSQEAAEVLSDYLSIWKIIIALINSIDKHVPFPKNLEEDYQRISTQYTNLYCNLLSMLREHTAKELKLESY